MKKILINYGDEKYRGAQSVNTWTGKHIAKFDEVIEYGPKDLDEQFKKENATILAVKRGGGAWLWKPYVILKHLRKMQDGDFLFYCDSGAYFVRNVKHILKAMNGKHIFVANLPLIEYQFTQDAVFEALDAAGNECKNTQQIQATFIGMIKNDETVTFVERWFNLCKDPKLLLNERNNGESEIGHREDQSILSVLCKVSGIRPHKDPTQYGRFPERYHGDPEWEYRVPEHEDTYKPVICSHRMKNPTVRVLINQTLLCLLPERISKKVAKKS